MDDRLREGKNTCARLAGGARRLRKIPPAQPPRSAIPRLEEVAARCPGGRDFGESLEAKVADQAPALFHYGFTRRDAVKGWQAEGFATEGRWKDDVGTVVGGR